MQIFAGGTLMLPINAGWLLTVTIFAAQLVLKEGLKNKSNYDYFIEGGVSEGQWLLYFIYFFVSNALIISKSLIINCTIPSKMFGELLTCN